MDDVLPKEDLVPATAHEQGDGQCGNLSKETLPPYSGVKQVTTTAVSKLTSKNQTTIPGPVREALGLSAGDLLAFEVIAGGSVVVRKWTSIDVEFTQAVESTLSEWASKEDDEAYRDL
jgi:antitoxin PrlF